MQYHPCCPIALLPPSSLSAYLLQTTSKQAIYTYIYVYTYQTIIPVPIQNKNNYNTILIVKVVATPFFFFPFFSSFFFRKSSPTSCPSLPSRLVKKKNTYYRKSEISIFSNPIGTLELISSTSPVLLYLTFRYLSSSLPFSSRPSVRVPERFRSGKQKKKKIGLLFRYYLGLRYSSIRLPRY